MDLGSHEGGALTSITSHSLPSPTGRREMSNRKTRSLATARERPPPLPPPASQWEATTTWTLTFLQCILVQNSPSQLPSFLYQRMLSSFVLWTCLFFGPVLLCLSWIAISLLFWINSILPAELLSFLFQNVDNLNNLNSGLQGKVYTCFPL